MSDVMVRSRARALDGFVFAGTTFLSSLLMFAVEPMVGKALLPAFGGGATVWASVMLFFQCIVLAGYGLAHGAIARLGLARAALLLVGIAATGLALIPTTPAIVDPGAGPAVAVFLTLAAGYGLACLALSAATPSVQAWFGGLNGREPYRLYAISNAGSLLGLVLYPSVLEPCFGLHAQGMLWQGGFMIWLVALCVCAAYVLRASRRTGGAATIMAARTMVAREAVPAWSRRASWLVLAMLPSSLLLGVTTHITVDVAPFPLLWIAPLGLYLLTFIAAFAAPAATLQRGRIYHAVCLPLLVLFALRPELDLHAPVMSISVHLAGFVACALLCHGRLAALRPGTSRLTEFYLVVSAGGALGGIANVILAPLLLDRLAEYPLMLAATCLILPPLWSRRLMVPGRAWSALLPALALAAILLAQVYGADLPILANDAFRIAIIPLALIAAAAALGTTRLGLTAVAVVGLVGPLYLDVSAHGPLLFSFARFLWSAACDREGPNATAAPRHDDPWHAAR